MLRLSKCILYRFCVTKTLNHRQHHGILTVIPTPIGNLSDLTPNIVKKLFDADLIGCQDRRVAGHLYKLIKNKKIIEQMKAKYEQLNFNAIIETQEKPMNNDKIQNQDFAAYEMMSERQRRKLLSKMSLVEQKKFKLDFLKYKSDKILNRYQQFSNKPSGDIFDEIYGINSSDLGNIDLQIKRTRIKKGRGLLIPLNTYSQTKMFDLVRVLLETKKVAIVTDAGMPCISDPGWKMVNHIRQKMPKVPIQVIGGPSTVSILSILANLSTNNSNLSGRFEGFASNQIALKAAEQDLKYNKIQDFSIHFINMKKIKKYAIGLERVYGKNHRIIITSELTKKFERKFHGSLGEFNRILTNNENAFEFGGGEMSFIIYAQPTKSSERKEQIGNISETISISAVQLIEQLKNKEMSNNKKAQVLMGIFGMKPNQAKRRIYSEFKQLKSVKHFQTLQKINK